MSEQPKKLFLLDAMALIYRAYFAFGSKPITTSKGQNTSAMFGFTNTLLEVLQKQRPTHLAIVFDTAAPTARHVDHVEYKANRQEIPEDIAAAIPYVYRLAEAMNIALLFLDGYEADDIIGTLAVKAEKEGFDTYMMTPDKDFGQLVDEHTFIYKPARAGLGAEVMGVKEVCERWQIDRVEQVKDILGLMGDSVDNIPGIPGVGEKTAMALVKQFGSIENLLENTDQLKGKLKEKVENNKELAIQSKRLATIILDVPVDVNLDNLKLKEPNNDALKNLFAELEFKTLAERLHLAVTSKPATGNGSGTTTQESLFGAATVLSPSKPKKVPSKATAVVEVSTEVAEAESEIEIAPAEVTHTPLKSINDIPHQYHIADTAEKRAELIQQLNQQQSICFDTETTHVDTLEAELVGMSFSFKAHEGYYVPIPLDQEQAKAIIKEFKPVFENEKINKIAQNIKFDISMLSRYDVEVKGKLFDTMVAHFLLQPDRSHSMGSMSEAYLGYSPISIEALIGKKGKNQGSMTDVPLAQIAEYAAEDADVTWQLHGKIQEELGVHTDLQKLFDEVEMPLVPVLSDMESEGINVDVHSLAELSEVLAVDIAKYEEEIQQMAGAKFNVASPKQVGEMLFGVMKISEKPPKTKTGQYSTSEDVLVKLENYHPIIRKILDYRELVKLKNTYVDVLPTMINPSTHRLHTSYNQVVAATGRLSSDNPNLQNIPIRTERGREIRKAFIPRDDKHVLLSADYSQIELRIIAELSGDKGMLDAFTSGEDIHTATASKVYNVPLGEVSSLMRRNAKMVNFGIVYGISAFGLSERLNIPRSEAKQIIENYFLKYPSIREYMNGCMEQARQKGYIETILGRRRYLPDIRSANATVRGFAERVAINAPIQGSAADMIKVAMINIHRDLQKEKLKSKMLLQVHDELVFDVLKGEEEPVKKIVEHRMKTALPLKVPVEIGIGTGNTWLDAH